EHINGRGKVLKTARQRKSKIQFVEDIIPLQAIKRKIDPLQDVVEAQADLVNRMKEVNNERTLENGKKIKMKHEATQELTESEQISLTLTIESMILSYIGIKTNQFAILEVFSTEPEKLSQDADQNNQIEELSQNANQNIQIETERIRAQQMEMDIEEISEKKETNETRERLSYSAVLTGKDIRKVRDNNSE
ncbi:46414_t:CDS:2, partial [Gigaspora margarita]